MRPVHFVDERRHSTLLGAEPKHLSLVLGGHFDGQIWLHPSWKQRLTVAQNRFRGCDPQNLSARQRRIGIFYRATSSSLTDEQSFIVNFECPGQRFRAAGGIAVSQDDNQTLKCWVAVRTE